MADLSFAYRGHCRNHSPDLFVTTGKSPRVRHLQRQAARICRGWIAGGVECPVLAECLAYALEHDERSGVWGGVTERERETMIITRSNC